MPRRGGQKLKLLYDTMPRLKVIVTGSSSLDLRARVGKFMVGRILTFMLTPFHFGEYLRARNHRLEGIYRRNNDHARDFFTRETWKPPRNGVDLFSSDMIPAFEDFCIWGGLSRRGPESEPDGAAENPGRDI